MKTTALFFSLSFMLLLSACQSLSPLDRYQKTVAQGEARDEDKQTGAGFLRDYSVLKKVDGVDGEKVLRWSHPEFKKGRFSKVLLDSVEVFPIEGQAVEISESSRKEIKQYFDSQLRASLGKNYQLTDQAGQGVARVRVAITGIELSSEGIKVTEFLPYGAVIGLLRTATGTRNQEVNVVLEMEILESSSAEPMLALVRVGAGENVRMLWDANFSIEHVQSLLDEWVVLAREGFSIFTN